MFVQVCILIITLVSSDCLMLMSCLTGGCDLVGGVWGQDQCSTESGSEEQRPYPKYCDFIPVQ